VPNPSVPNPSVPNPSVPNPSVPNPSVPNPNHQFYEVAHPDLSPRCVAAPRSKWDSNRWPRSIQIYTRYEHTLTNWCRLTPYHYRLSEFQMLEAANFIAKHDVDKDRELNLQVSVLQVQCAPSAVCSKCSVLQVQYAPSVVCSKCSVLQVQYAPSAVCSKCSVLRVQCAPSAVCSKCSVLLCSNQQSFSIRNLYNPYLHLH
jgi:hypothetical protein